jgi:hypothetical protein
MSELTPLIQTLITFTTGFISLAVLAIVWKIASAFTTWTAALKTLGIDIVKLEKSNTEGHVEIKIALGNVKTKVDNVGERVTDLEKEVRDGNDTRQ